MAVGAILSGALKRLGIHIGTHIKECANIQDLPFNDIQNEVLSLDCDKFPTIDEDCGLRMKEAILGAREDCDSVGGITETAIVGMPAGVGEPFFDSIEGVFSHALFGIGGIKGVEFGRGFAMSKMRGSQANDALCMDCENVVLKSNNNGGINGGITNGMPILFRCAVKPTPSIFKVQESVNFVTGEDIKLEIKGRHDPAIVRRICPVINAISALCVCDMLAQRYGTDVFVNGINK